MDLAADFQELFTVGSLISFITLAVLEIVLGIDNIIFISIIASKLPIAQQPRARIIGLALALLMRVILLFSLSWVIGLKYPLFSISDFGVTGRDIILFLGGVFLLYKSTREIHNKIEGYDDEVSDIKKISFNAVLSQIVLIDIVFSFDSILTAVGLVDNILIMILAVVVAIVTMMLFAHKVSSFINKHPTIKMLALAFLLMIGVMLILEAFHQHVDKKFIYVSMAFSLLVEGLNMRMNKKKKIEKKGIEEDPREV